MEDNPIITYWDDGTIMSISYGDQMNQSHRLDGPAWKTFFHNGGLNNEIYWVNGRSKNKIAYKVIEELGISQIDDEWTDIERDMFKFHFITRIS